MILVDTSVWIDFLQDADSLYAVKLGGLIQGTNKAAICGIILQEILQGIKDDEGYNSTKERLSRLPFINTDKDIYLYASSLYRTLRSQGFTIPSGDVTIAALAILRKVPLFTKDKHFKDIAQNSPLELHPA